MNPSEGLVPSAILGRSTKDPNQNTQAMEIIVKTKSGETRVFTKNTNGHDSPTVEDILAEFKRIHAGSAATEGWEIVKVKP